jgi:hypothetical protein
MLKWVPPQVSGFGMRRTYVWLRDRESRDGVAQEIVRSEGPVRILRIAHQNRHFGSYFDGLDKQGSLSYNVAQKEI